MKTIRLKYLLFLLSIFLCPAIASNAYADSLTTFSLVPDTLRGYPNSGMSISAVYAEVTLRTVQDPGSPTFEFTEADTWSASFQIYSGSVGPGLGGDIISLYPDNYLMYQKPLYLWGMKRSFGLGQGNQTYLAVNAPNRTWEQFNPTPPSPDYNFIGAWMRCNENEEEGIIPASIVTMVPLYGEGIYSDTPMVRISINHPSMGQFAFEGIYAAQIQSSVVPEPATLALLSLGIIGLIGYGWNRKWEFLGHNT